MSHVRQMEIIEMILDYWRDAWTSPTVEQIAVALGISKSTAHMRLGKMVDEGWLERKTLSSKRVLYRVAGSPSSRTKENRLSRRDT